MKTVALVEIGNGGHHDAYMRYFVSSLLELDCRVICLIPDTAPIREWVNKKYPNLADRVIYHPLRFHRNRLLFLGRYRERVNIIYDWYKINRLVSKIEKRSGIKTDLVFMGILDYYLINRMPPAWLDQIITKKWSGLYFFPSLISQHPELLNQQPQANHRDILLLAKNCVGIGLLNNSLYQPYSKRIGKPVVLFPDIADSTTPDPESQIAQEIRNQAKGRTVIGTIGLEWHKCGYEFLQLAKHADPEKFFFAFTGPMYDHFLNHYPQEQVAEIRQFKENLPANCFWNTGTLAEGAEYNAVINSFDILWVVYKNFYGSSNRLTKAAIFHKLVLSNSDYCIGENVTRYGLGEAMTDTNIPTMLQAIDRLQKRIESGDLPFASWESYSKMQSTDVLKEKFREILGLL